MGVFVIMEDEAGSPVPVTEIPPDFRFSDTNPITGRPYSHSRWRDLPEYAADMIERTTSLCGGEWDVLVEDGEVSEFIDVDRRHPLKGWVSRLAGRQKTGRASKGMCPDCLGTSVMLDTDGSMTGRIGTPILCYCSEPVPERRSSNPFRTSDEDWTLGRVLDDAR